MKFKILTIAVAFLAILACKGMEDLDLPPLIPELMHNPDYQILLENATLQGSILKQSPQEILEILRKLEIIEQQANQQNCILPQTLDVNTKGKKPSALIYTCRKCRKTDLKSYAAVRSHLSSYHGISRNEFSENGKKYYNSQKVYIG